MTQDPVLEFFALYPPAVADLAAGLRAKIQAAIPEATETVDRAGRIVGYSVAPGYAGLVCTIIPSKTGVKLGIVGGADLADPHGLLEGEGKKHRYVRFDTTADFRRSGLEALLSAAGRRVRETLGRGTK